MNLIIISQQKENELLNKKIVQFFNEKHDGNKENFLQRLDIYCLEIAKDLQCQFRKLNDDLYFFHKYSQIDPDKYLEQIKNENL